MREFEELFTALGRSQFRRGFQLRGKELVYLQEKGLPVVLVHAEDFINKRLAPANIQNDGKQTPFRGHPAFVAQHATACCCRGCLYKWHRIEPGKVLSADEKNYVMAVLKQWLSMQLQIPHR